MRELIKRVIISETERASVTIAGWVRTRRDSKTFSFLEINDGSCLANLQVVADAGIPGYADVERMHTGASVEITGRLVASLGQGQKWEMQAAQIRLIGEVSRFGVVALPARHHRPRLYFPAKFDYRHKTISHVAIAFFGTRMRSGTKSRQRTPGRRRKPNGQAWLAVVVAFLNVAR